MLEVAYVGARREFAQKYVKDLLDKDEALKTKIRVEVERAVREAFTEQVSAKLFEGLRSTVYEVPAGAWPKKQMED